MCEPVDTRLTVLVRRHYPEDPSYQLIDEEDGGPVSWEQKASYRVFLIFGAIQSDLRSLFSLGMNRAKRLFVATNSTHEKSGTSHTSGSHEPIFLLEDIDHFISVDQSLAWEMMMMENPVLPGVAMVAKLCHSYSEPVENRWTDPGTGFSSSFRRSYFDQALGIFYNVVNERLHGMWWERKTLRMGTFWNLIQGSMSEQLR
ncbi:hypothetical protein EDD85DRAFT_793054 [Armillaria nabsnona]|nr:hypothetical protein EDD85DRAFT_793054 [Armillaria nabsnona]